MACGHRGKRRAGDWETGTGDHCHASNSQRRGPAQSTGSSACALRRLSLCITSSLWIHSQASSEQLRADIRHQGQRAERPDGQGALTHSSSPYLTTVTFRGLAAVLLLLSKSYASSLWTTLTGIGKKGTVQHSTLPNLFK